MNDNDAVHDVIQVEDVIEEINNDHNTIYGEPINNYFLQPVGKKEGTTRMMIENEGVSYA